MSHFAFIFARGGSKGLPGKNSMPLLGKPLIAYSIETAKSIAMIAEVFVSTEDSRIAEIAAKYGATVIARPAELATDTSPEWQSWRHAVNWVKKNRGPISTFISLPATSPLRSQHDVLAAVTKLQHSGADICLAVTPTNRNPWFNMVIKKEDGQIERVIIPEETVTRRQDAPAVFDITPVVYVARPDYIMSNPSIFSGKVVAIDVPKVRAVDIDDIFDFSLAQAIMLQTETEYKG